MSDALTADNPLKLVLPKGRIQEKVLALLKDVGLTFRSTSRSYRPTVNDASVEAKIMKAQNIPALVALGRHDCGFTGQDWVYEQDVEDQVELVLDLGFDPVKIVAAIPEDLLNSDANPFKNHDRQIIVASEYKRCTEAFIAKHSLNAVYMQSYGATESLPPEDADIIVDNTATGATLLMNRLSIVDVIRTSTTHFIASKQAMNDPVKRARILEMKMLMEASLRAASRVLIEMNVSKDAFDSVIDLLKDHSMNSPTISNLWQDAGYSVKVAVPTKIVHTLIPELVKAGASDILEYKLEKIVP
jgi:ATP phosphoribosyltransferase